MSEQGWRAYALERERIYGELYRLAERVAVSLAVEESEHGFPFHCEARAALRELRAFVDDDGGDGGVGPGRGARRVSATGSIQGPQEDAG